MSTQQPSPLSLPPREALPPYLEIEAEILRRDFRRFLRAAWRIVEPRPLVHGWHMDAIAEHLGAVSAGQVRNLLVMVPPRTSKSLECSVLWPAWEWASNPGLRFLTASHEDGLATHLSGLSRKLVESPWYQERWGPGSHAAQRGHPFVQLSADTNAKGKYDTTAGGGREALGVRAGVTGKGGDRLLVDDPHDASRVEGQADRDYVRDWWDGTFFNRANDARTVARVVIMQRVHAGDLAGHLLEQGGWEVLMLPLRFDPARRCVTSLGVVDKRTTEGELLNPERMGETEARELERTMGPTKAAAQLQQAPEEGAGGVFQREWMALRWRLPETPAPADRRTIVLPSRRDFVVGCLSVDCTFKKTEGSDRVGIGIWGISRTDFRRRWLLYRRADRMSFWDTVEALRELHADPKWKGLLQATLIEDAANGQAVIETLQRIDGIPGVLAVKPLGGKRARAAAVQPQFAAGDVVVADLLEDPTVGRYVSEVAGFTGEEGRPDDEVDQTSQALLHLADLGATLAGAEALAQW